MKNNSIEYQKNRALKRKVYLINLRGGKCEKCPYDKNIAALEFHHLNPQEKDNNLDSRHLSNRSMEWIMKEFEKCIVLCSNCHKEIHHPELTMEKSIEKLKKINDEKILKFQTGKPKCLDCETEINYTYKRCKNCNDIHKRKVKNRPSITEIEELRNKFSLDEIASKYNVSRRTIGRWLSK